MISFNHITQLFQYNDYEFECLTPLGLDKEESVDS